MGNKKLFISHASKDKPLVDRFVDLILDNGCNVDQNDIYYTSNLDMGIKPGKDFIADIKRNMTESRLIILMISPNFYNSVFCLGEVGATWMLDVDTFPIVVPEFKLRDVKDILQVTQMGMLDDQDYLDRLHDAVIEKLGIAISKTGTWNQKCDQFLKELPKLISELPKPDKVKLDKYRELEEKYQAAQEDIELKEVEINKLETTIEQLKKAKDKEEVNEILLSQSTAKEQFEYLTKRVSDALASLPFVVGRAFFHSSIGEPFWPENDFYSGNKEYDEAIKASRNGYLIERVGFPFLPNVEDPSVEAAQAAISMLDRFIRSIPPDEEFAYFFREEYVLAFKDCMSNERFWKQFLYR